MPEMLNIFITLNPKKIIQLNKRLERHYKYWIYANPGEIFELSLERGCLLYHHSCKSESKRRENKVKIVFVGFTPGWIISTAYDGHFWAAISATNLFPILLQLGSLLRHESLQQGHGNSSRSYKRQQGPITLKLNWPPILEWIEPWSIRLWTPSFGKTSEIN